MEGFKQFKKVQCFKEGGTVQRKIENFEKRERKVEEKDDMAQDKKVVKKAFSIHDKQQHEEKTDLSKLRKGGRAKKDKGTVKKFKSGGEVTNVYEAKKSSGDKDNIKKVKDIKAVKLCGGKSVKKMADGGMTDDPNDIGGGVLNAIGKVPLVGGALQSGATTLRNNVMGTPEQNRIAREQMDKVARRKAMAAAAMQGANAGGLGAAAQQSDIAQGLPAMPAGRKKGGKACK
jgi:hypothetical protein